MAVNSGTFTLVSVPVTLAGPSYNNVEQTTADVSIVSNSTYGTLYAAIRSDRAWLPGEEALIVGGATGDWAGSVTPIIGVNALSAVGLNVSVTQYVGFTQSDATTHSTLVTDEFVTTSYPAGQEAPYQLNGYPDRINYQGVPVYVDLMYSWGGDDPKSITVTNLPAGLEMSTAGIVTGTPTNVAQRTVEVTVLNGAGSATVSFGWRTYALANIAPSVEGMTKLDLWNHCKAYADRATDPELEANRDGLFRFAEDRMSRIMQNREMSRRALIPLFEGTEYYDLPEDYAGFRDVVLVSGEGKKTPLHYLNPEQANVRSNRPIDSSNRFGYYTIIGNQVWILGGPAGDLEVTYYQRVAPLVADDDSNWVTKNHTDLYQNALLAQIETFTKNDGRAVMYDEALSRCFDEIAGRDEKDRWSGNPLQVRMG